MTTPIKDIVIPKDQAVFWLDRHGYWHNRHGKFQHKKIIDFFHTSINKDEGGYFLMQLRDNVREKVYFPYEDTALFVFDVFDESSILLVLNTGRRLRLDPENLFIQADHLYVNDDNERIKFNERSLYKMSGYIGLDSGGYFFEREGHRLLIRQV